MLYFDPAVVTDLVEAEGATGIEVVRPAVSDRVLATRFAALFGSLTLVSGPASSSASTVRPLLSAMRSTTLVTYALFGPSEKVR